MTLSWTPAHAQALDELLAGPPGFAALDWDNTCVRGDVEETLLAWYDLQDGARRMAEYARRCEASIDDGFTYAAVACVEGRTPADVEFSADASLDWGLATGRIALRDAMIVLVARLRTAGWDVRIVTASAAAVVRVAARRYGFAPAQVIGVEIPLGPTGRYGAVARPPLTWRAGKVLAIEQTVGRRPDFAVGDTATDIEMLRSARIGLLLDRGNVEARAAAEAHGWWIQPANDGPAEDPWVAPSGD